MKQATMIAPGQIRFDQVPKPTPGPGQVLLHIRRIGVCGSDIHVWHGQHPFTPYPVIQGHEYSATVAAVGPDVRGIRIGAKVTAMPQIVCGQCRACRSGNYHICDNLKVQGFQAPGTAQDYFIASPDKLILLPDSFSFEQGAFVEPAAVAAHATRRPGDIASHNVVVAGAGPIGNLVAQSARARGANVLITDISDHRLQIARDCGLAHTCNTRDQKLDAALQRTFGPDGFQTAFECAGAEAAMNALIAGIRKGGTIVSVGLYGKTPTIDMSTVCEHELKIIGTLMYQRPDYEQAVAWIAAGQLRLSALESIHFPFDQFTQAYQYIDQHRETTMKVFIDVND